MKIAQIVSLDESVPPQSKNGLEFIAAWVTDELIRRGHEVTLFATEHSKTSGKLISLLPDNLRILRDTPWRMIIHSIWNTTLVAAMAEQFDIIHTHTGTIVFSMPFIKTPVVQTLHEPYDDKFRSTYAGDGKGVPIDFIAEQFRKIHYASISLSQQKDYLTHGKNFFQHFTNIYDGIPIEQFEFNDTPKDYLFFIGYINKDKGVDIAIRVAQATRRKLIIAGNNKGEEAFFEKEIKPHLNNDIQYIGPIDFKQKVELYKNAYATLAPLRWAEPFGLTLVESQASGTPVIAFNKGAAKEIVKHGETGFVVETEQDMIDAVEKIGSINRAKCREWVAENFSVKKMVDGYEKLYNQILNSKENKKIE